MNLQLHTATEGIFRSLEDLDRNIANRGLYLARSVGGDNQSIVVRKHKEAGGKLRPSLMEVGRAAAEVGLNLTNSKFE
jgi:hypothetical protein